MNILLWVLQILAAVMYASSGVMKIFMFEKISHDVPSFGALPRRAWAALGVLELACTVGLVAPAAFHWLAHVTVAAAAFLAVESVLFIWVHVSYRETPAIVMSGVLGILMTFIAIGRAAIVPI